MSARMNPWHTEKDLRVVRRVGKTAEELCEAGAVCARIVIQGIDEIDPSSGQLNRRRLVDELADVQAQINCTRKALAIDAEYFDARVARKEDNMEDWESQVAGTGGLKIGARYRHRDGRVGVLIGPHPHDGALLILNEEDREDDEIMEFFACEGYELTPADDEVVVWSGAEVGKSEGMWLRFAKETSFGVTPSADTVNSLRKDPPRIFMRQSVCSKHPCATHGIDRDASHSQDRYVCNCEGQDFPCPGSDVYRGLCLGCPAR